MSDLLSRLLDERPWLLLDGATGTNLFAAGLMSGDAPEFWNVEEPDRIRALHRGFIAAGADVILTNSFGASRYRLKLHVAEERARELAAAAAALARECADAAERPIVVAGSVGPTGEILEPVGGLGHADAVASFREQITGLLEGGADVVWAETVSSTEELRAVAEAATELGAPYCATMSFDTAGRTMMGVTSEDFAAFVRTLPAPPAAFGANCGTGASDLLRTVLGLARAAPGAAIIAKANAGIPKYVGGHVHYDGTPELMAEYACLARDAGAGLIGGCCGTTAEHLRAMRRALESRPPGPRPNLDEIAAKTGPFTSADDGTGEAATAPKRHGRRRVRQE